MNKEKLRRNKILEIIPKQQQLEKYDKVEQISLWITIATALVGFATSYFIDKSFQSEICKNVMTKFLIVFGAEAGITIFIGILESRIKEKVDDIREQIIELTELKRNREETLNHYYYRREERTDEDIDNARDILESGGNIK